MSGLRDRLNRLKPSSPGANPPTVQERAEDHEWIGLDARMERNEWGQFVLRERRYSLDYRHGLYALGDLIGHASVLDVLNRSAGSLSGHEALLFLDTETTGLGIGAGNVPFMVGIGYYQGESYVVEQLFIRNPAEELAMLAYLREKLQSFSRVISYNGRTFDWPVLKNRFILNRIQLEDRHLHQIDLLYTSRSIWRSTLPSCRLGTVEEARLGVLREEDVPGSMAPALYFQYLAEGNPQAIEGVFDHNERDILSLSVLASHVTRLVQGRIRLSELEAGELYRVGAWLDKLELPELAEQAFRQLAERNGDEIRELRMPMAAYFKKKGDYRQAVRIWEDSIEENRNAGKFIPSVEPFIELAIHYEHRMKNAKQALAYAEEALQAARKRISLARGDRKQRLLAENLQKRIERLMRKVDKQMPMLFDVDEEIEPTN
ncbi:ribonuclease H-like domain-containing protein [Ferviditalea candida]|uniref:Ribonuclease H-like domain-containing protein n=1 Tax=Ferviditalea candida TaxID=3108399 RepID=A0ABU5ZJK5_9BACL|nr:ribonuclease H-like domain-containing protein [Paenibacillaceae bacterium T2]